MLTPPKSDMLEFIKGYLEGGECCQNGTGVTEEELYYSSSDTFQDGVGWGIRHSFEGTPNAILAAIKIYYTGAL